MSESPKRPEQIPVWLYMQTPFERFAWLLGFSRCPDGRLHADWHRFQAETNPTGGKRP